MRNRTVRSAVTALLLAASLAGCNKLGLGGLDLAGHQASKRLPTPRQLKAIAYMSQKAAPDGRKIYDHLEQAKSCHDLEIAMRWNRPPDVKSGPFNQKMTYVSASLPADLAKNSEMFVTGVIKAGQSLSTGGAVWALKLKDGTQIQAVESQQYTDQQSEAQQAGGHATMVHPYTPGRLLCAYGVYQGNIGTVDQQQHVPMVSILFAMDRAK